MRIRSVVLGLLVLSTLPLLAVDVPVFVARNGAPVAGLEASDFELYVNGERTPIAAVEPARPQRFMLLFDVATLNPHVKLGAVESATEFLKEAPKDAEFAVATYASRGVYIMTPFTTERAVLLQAMTTIPRRMQGISRPEDQFEDLAELADHLSAGDRQTHVLLLSGGYFSSSYYPGRYASNAFPSPRSFSRLSQSRYHEAIDEVHDRYIAANVFLHAFEMRGLTAFQLNDSRYLLSTGTGGEFVHGNNDITVALARTVAKYNRGYVLRFDPENVKRGINSVEVKVTGANGAEVVHRLGFVDGAPRVGATREQATLR